jgi:hypothetical protein
MGVSGVSEVGSVELIALDGVAGSVSGSSARGAGTRPWTGGGEPRSADGYVLRSAATNGRLASTEPRVARSAASRRKAR